LKVAHFASPKRSLPTLLIMDRYILGMALWPTVACLGVMVVALLFERMLSLLDILSHSNAGVGPVLKLTAWLLPHFVGLALPLALFVALFIIVTRLDDGSEVAAFLANGVPLSRITAPLVAVACGLMLLTLLVFGFAQPYSRYAYRAGFYAAINSGWNGRLAGGAFVSRDGNFMTADDANMEGTKLRHVFIRRLRPAGEEVLTASSAELIKQPDGKSVALVLHQGQRVLEKRAGGVETLRFERFSVLTDLAAAATLGRGRGSDQRELTFTELARAAAAGTSFIPRSTLLSELYGRLARCAILPFLPLMAVPLGLSAKRRRRGAGLISAAVVLIGFQIGLQFGQGLAQSNKVSPELGVGLPVVLFAGFCLWIFAASLKRPGETPIGLFVQAFGDWLDRLLPQKRDTPWNGV
jgi:lipopolysaccharide export system permease protein